MTARESRYGGVDESPDDLAPAFLSPGRPVEPGDRERLGLTGRHGAPTAADIPRSYRAFPPEASTITIQTPGAPARYAADVATAQQHIRWHDGTHIRDIDHAAREVLLQLAEHLTATGRVADAEADLTPTIVVRLDVKTWPAIPGITTPAEEHP